MQNTIYNVEKKILALAKKVNFADVLPFQEKPSIEMVNKEGKTEDLQAYDLFSIFTANIIKQEVLFTR